MLPLLSWWSFGNRGTRETSTSIRTGKTIKTNKRWGTEDVTYGKRKLPLHTKTVLEICHCLLLFFQKSDAKWLCLKHLVSVWTKYSKLCQCFFQLRWRLKGPLALLVYSWPRCDLSLWQLNWYLLLPWPLFVEIQLKHDFQQDDSLRNLFVHHSVIFCFPVTSRVCFSSWGGSSKAHWSLEGFSYF